MRRETLVFAVLCVLLGGGKINCGPANQEEAYLSVTVYCHYTIKPAFRCFKTMEEGLEGGVVFCLQFE